MDSDIHYRFHALDLGNCIEQSWGALCKTDRTKKRPLQKPFHPHFLTDPPSPPSIFTGESRLGLFFISSSALFICLHFHGHQHGHSSRHGCSPHDTITNLKGKAQPRLLFCPFVLSFYHILLVIPSCMMWVFVFRLDLAFSNGFAKQSPILHGLSRWNSALHHRLQFLWYFSKIPYSFSSS